MTETTTTPISSIVELYCRRIDESGPQAALAYKREGEYHWLTWNDLAQETCRAVAALVKLGVQPGDRVAHVSENRYEWVIADLAIQMAGAIHVPIHSPLTGVQIAWQVRHSGAKVVLLSGPGQADKFAALGEDCPRELTWVSYDPVAGECGGRPVHRWSELLASAPLESGIDAACQTRKLIAPDSLATIIYTSGTTGEPKGVMLTQHNLATNAIDTCAACQWEGDELRLNFLPLSHIFARTCDLYCWIAGGTRLALAESRETILADCRAIHPTLINGVPHFYDRLYRGLCEKGLADTPGALQGMLGGAIRHCCGGGAALPEHLYDFFHARGVPLLQGYGLTETSPVITISTETAHRRGSSGRPLPGVEIRIAEDGEILTRGPHVMVGYYRNQAATDEILKDGWLATGDLGRIDEDGFLYITGRKKEIIVTLGGKNVAPVMLESLLTQDPLFVQALVVGDDRPYLAALLVANPEVLAAEMQARKIEVDAPEKILTHPGVVELIEERVRRQLASVSHYEQVQRFALLPRGFSIEHGELTAKLSLRRKVIQEHFAAEIDSLYRRE
ncbi:MAG: AMP-dependent synthetase/ligase [Pirellulaceae bacterium]|nr:AMP-dependent synthetase/ligase [Pirellulaceae bacterium]